MPVKKLKVKSEKFPPKADQPLAEKVKVGAKKLVKKVKAKKIAKVEPKKTRMNRLTIEVFNTLGKAAGTIELPKEIFGVKVNEKLLAQAVRVYLSNQRQGTSSTKTRGEVHGSTRKIWQQKYTGRARHGSRKAPIFVHGGVLGPKPRDYSLKLSKKMRRLALFSALSQKLKENQIKAVAGLDKITPKTKIMAGIIKNLGIDEKKRNILLVTPSTIKEFENVYRATRNIKGVHISSANMLNTYQVLDNKVMILMKQSIDKIRENFLKE